jgi:hypothetical protein
MEKMFKPITEYKYDFREGFRKRLKKYEENIILKHKYWYWLSLNSRAIPILEKNLDKVDWLCLSYNPNAIHLLEKNLDKVDWQGLSTNPNAIHILDNNLDKVDWDELSRNPNAIPILEKNLNKAFVYQLLRNPNIFVDEYECVCHDYFKQYVTEDIMKVVFHPRNLHRMKDLGFDETDEE